MNTIVVNAFEKIWNETKAAAQRAAQVENLGFAQSERHRGFDCGFAWITIRPARGPFVKWLKANGIARGSYDGGSGAGIWYSQLHDVPTQSVSVHQKAVVAAAEVLKRYGINATTGSRLD